MTVHDHTVDHSAADHEHSHHDGDVVALPGKPDLRQLRTRAKDLRRGARGGNPADLATIREHHPRGAELVEAPDGLTLRATQLALARSYGLPGWNALVDNVGRVRSKSATCTGSSALSSTTRSGARSMTGCHRTATSRTESSRSTAPTPPFGTGWTPATRPTRRAASTSSPASPRRSA